MKLVYGLLATLPALALAACVSATPPDLADDSPANSKAPAGFVASPVALEDYKSEQDFSSRAEEDAKAPVVDHSAHGGTSK